MPAPGKGPADPIDVCRANWLNQETSCTKLGWDGQARVRPLALWPCGHVTRCPTRKGYCPIEFGQPSHMANASLAVKFYEGRVRARRGRGTPCAQRRTVPAVSGI